ncbi:hypothetical protein NMY22_g2193 [Coprinellus aureogranulatus]|nr:hypothetical protein NMY22_g2193 [Coprinellus aureogranulatus]
MVCPPFFQHPIWSIPSNPKEVESAAPPSHLRDIVPNPIAEVGRNFVPEADFKCVGVFQASRSTTRSMRPMVIFRYISSGRLASLEAPQYTNFNKLHHE